MSNHPCLRCSEKTAAKPKKFCDSCSALILGVVKNAISNSDIDRRFAAHPLHLEADRAAVASIREICRTLALVINRIVPPGREQDTALTKLEETMFHAVAGIARSVPKAGVEL